MKTKIMTRQIIRNSTNRSLLRCGFILIALVCFALPPASRALLPPPPPDGGYPNGNTAEGDGALFSLTFGLRNTALGFDALFSNTTGSFNTATGDTALANNTTGSFNTATGIGALFSNRTGDANTATGDGALAHNTIGQENTATGVSALLSNTTGFWNTATGLQALSSNTTGAANTATGFLALNNNRTGDDNTATGENALSNNKTGNNNTATGDNALQNNITGNNNTATGRLALNFNTTGNINTANGSRALFNNTTGSRNIALGVNSGISLTTGDSNIDIGNPGVAAEASTIRIGVQGTQTRTFVAGISGSPIAGTNVVVNPVGRLGTMTSSARFKDDIKPMDKASEAILALKPVTFHYKQELDPDGISQFGLIAEEVEKVNPDLVVRDQDGKVNTVRYEAVNAMLLNEFLKEHRKVAEQQATIDQLKASANEQQKQIETLRTSLQKIDARLALHSKSKARTAANN
jgi:hypothetical protein